MALDGMHDELFRFLNEQGATKFLIEAWEDVWFGALAFPGDPLPCPKCFLDGRVRRLVPLARVGKLGAARCEACKTKFEFYDR